MSKIPLFVRTAPKTIFLQISDEAHDYTEPFPRLHGGEVTWCEDSVTNCQVKYVRADLAAQSIDIGKLRELVMKWRGGLLIPFRPDELDGCKGWYLTGREDAIKAKINELEIFLATTSTAK